LPADFGFTQRIAHAQALVQGTQQCVTLFAGVHRLDIVVQIQRPEAIVNDVHEQLAFPVNESETGR